MIESDGVSHAEGQGLKMANKFSHYLDTNFQLVKDIDTVVFAITSILYKKIRQSLEQKNDL